MLYPAMPYARGTELPRRIQTVHRLEGSVVRPSFLA